MGLQNWQKKKSKYTYVVFNISPKAMVDYTWSISEYEQLPYPQKKIKLMNLFEIFQGNSVSIQQMLPLLDQDKIGENEMVQAYRSLTTAIQSIEKKDIKKAIDQIDTLHLQIENIRKQEAKEKKNEDPEILLQNI